VAELLPKKLDAARTATALEAAMHLVSSVDLSDHDSTEAAFRARAEELGLKLGDMLMPLRVAVTGTKVSPPLFQSIAVLGKEKALSRAARALASLRAAVQTIVQGVQNE
jgi:glutamyl-tRNA synthetase